MHLSIHEVADRDIGLAVAQPLKAISASRSERRADRAHGSLLQRDGDVFALAETEERSTQDSQHRDMHAGHAAVSVVGRNIARKQWRPPQRCTISCEKPDPPAQKHMLPASFLHRTENKQNDGVVPSDRIAARLPACEARCAHWTVGMRYDDPSKPSLQAPHAPVWRCRSGPKADMHIRTGSAAKPRRNAMPASGPQTPVADAGHRPSSTGCSTSPQCSSGCTVVDALLG